jgi:DNA-binding NarL/FixJ family response regulator
MSDARIRVAIADDQTLFCSGIQMLIESQPDLLFVGSAADGVAIVELAHEQRPQVILMDIRMPGADGLTATERILAGMADDPPRVIVLTTFQRDVTVLRAISAGASGFIMKDATPEFLLAAIRTVHAGQSVIAPGETLSLIQTLAAGGKGERGAQPDDTSLAVLSPREKEVFLFAARGLSNAEIATTAYISETTVKSHISSILAKLQMQSRLQMVVHAYEHHLLR